MQLDGNFFWFLASFVAACPPYRRFLIACVHESTANVARPQCAVKEVVDQFLYSLLASYNRYDRS